MSSAPLLVELFVEELPPRALKKLGEAFASLLADSLKAHGLAPADAPVGAYASPRRLAVHIAGVLAVAADQALTRKVMPAAVALAGDGRPTAAFRKAAAKLGREALVDRWPDAVDGPDRFFIQAEGKADAVFFTTLAKGTALPAGLQIALDDTLARLPIPKVMQYQLADGWTSVGFVRPAHGLVALHGDRVVPVSALGLAAGRTTHGHRFEASVPLITLDGAASYAAQLREQGAVIASFAERRAELVRQLDAAAAAVGLRYVDDEALLDEVTALVERPNALLCRFEPAFLAVPQECLILTMKANQKYFPLLDGSGKLSNRFVVVSNIRPGDPSRVIEGNERVVRPRLADAKFFFDQDRKRTLESRVPALDQVVYHGKLGSQGARVQRVRGIARTVGGQLGGAALAASADRAALLAKADLLTDMVGEFPELQGTMGGYYARHDGESDAVALAIADQYQPRFAGDALPREACGVVLALADKLETLAGLFSIGAAPTGDKDPFALRRHALGVVRMLVERALPLEVAALLDTAFAAFGEVPPAARTDLMQFLRERLAGYLRELGYGTLEVEAVLEPRPARWADLPQRLAAVRRFLALSEAAPLAAANKRVGNILRKSAAPAAAAEVQPALFAEESERSLYAALQSVSARASAAFEQGDHAASLQALAALKAPVDAFFDQVMVNTDDAALRANRLALLGQLQAAMNQVADLSRLAA